MTHNRSRSLARTTHCSPPAPAHACVVANTDAACLEASEASSLQSRVKSGALWSIVGFGASQVLRFLGNLLLTRLLFEEAFGLMALVGVFLQGLQLFSDIGIGPSIIQNRRGDDTRFLNTAWTLQIARGTLLWIVACAAAIPFARFYDAPELAWLLPICGLTAAIAGVNSSKLFAVNRNLAIRQLVIVEILSHAASLVVMVTWAVCDRSIWVLVAGGITGSMVKMVCSHTLLPGRRNRLHWDLSAAREIVRFGRWIFLSTILTFVVGQSDRLIFGKLVPIAMLGVYSIALMIAIMPAELMGHLTGRIAFPLYSRVCEQGGDLERTFRRTRWSLLAFGGWCVCGLLGGGPTAVRLLYDHRYSDAGWIIQLLAIGGWFVVLDANNGSVLLAKARPHLLAVASMAKLIVMLALIPLGYHLHGFAGAIAGFAAADMAKYAVSAFAVRRMHLRVLGQDVVLSCLVTLVSVCVWKLAAALRHWHAGALLEAAVVAGVVTIVWVPVRWRLASLAHGLHR